MTFGFVGPMTESGVPDTGNVELGGELDVGLERKKRSFQLYRSTKGIFSMPCIVAFINTAVEFVPIVASVAIDQSIPAGVLEFVVTPEEVVVAFQSAHEYSVTHIGKLYLV
jgi:hypothetical protein